MPSNRRNYRTQNITANHLGLNAEARQAEAVLPRLTKTTNLNKAQTAHEYSNVKYKNLNTSILMQKPNKQPWHTPNPTRLPNLKPRIQKQKPSHSIREAQLTHQHDVPVTIRRSYRVQTRYCEALERKSTAQTMMATGSHSRSMGHHPNG